ncbi:glycosyltransferase [Methylorubrum aminovorans]|uniref:glycosyltransferase n=1 Tax=Methylorubrum aminovorans TaxID=269069 RepID=UPI003C2E0012
MRIVIDLQCCQTAAGARGMGRYALALTKEIVRLGREHEFLFLLNGHLLSRATTIIEALEVSRDQFVTFEAPPLGGGVDDRASREKVADLLRNNRVETLSPDVYHVSSLFEGDSIYGSAVPYISLPQRPVINSAIIYDFIPALFREHYLVGSTMRDWYNRTLAVARTVDVHLAISEATKRDAERFLGVDPTQVTSILGDVDRIFRCLPATAPRVSKLWQRIGDRPFLLYVGGPDFRKNIDGLIEGFARAFGEPSAPYLLVLVLSLDETSKTRVEQLAKSLNIEGKIFITEFVTDEDLVELYNDCALFVFPSLYEGLGMPVIEAMRCGAPVLVGDNSSLIEVVPDPRYGFDASDSGSMAAAMSRVLGDRVELQRMRRDSLAQSFSFSWTESARRTLSVWEEAHAGRRARGRPSAERRPRIAMFTPLPAEKTGIADYAAEFLPALARHAEIEVFIDDALEVTPSVVTAAPVHHHTRFDHRRDAFDAVVYQLGNSPYHHYMLPYMQRHPGVIVLHDAYVGHLGHDPAHPSGFIEDVLREEGGRARRLMAGSGTREAGVRALIEAFSCGGGFVDASIGAIVHSRYARDTLGPVTSLRTGSRTSVIQQYRAGIAPTEMVDRTEARRVLGVPPDVEIVATFGHVASTKGIIELIAAFLACNAVHRGARLVFVGELEGGREAATPYAQQVLAAIRGRPEITITGFVDQQTYNLWLSAIDVGVQLRTISRGETSGAVLNLLANAKPLVYNRMGPTAELPTHVAIGLDSHDAGTVRGALDALLDDAGARERLERAAGDYTRATLDPDAIAGEFVGVVEDMAERARRSSPASLARSIGQVLLHAPQRESLVEETAQAFVRQERGEELPRLLIDVTGASGDDDGLGSLLREAYRADDRRFRPQGIVFSPDGPSLDDAFASACGALLPDEPIRQELLVLRPFDRLLLTPKSLAGRPSLSSFTETLVQRGGCIIALIDDLAPALRPERFPSRIGDALRESLDLLLAHESRFVCPAQRTVDDLAAYAAGLPRAGAAKLWTAIVPRAAWSTHDEAAATPTSANDPNDRPFFVVFGALSPDAGHAHVLEAFETLWQNGDGPDLTLALDPGWNMVDLLEGIGEHDAFGKRLSLLQAPPKAVRDRLRDRTAGVIVPSGSDAARCSYEAAHARGAPILVSDAADFFRPGPHVTVYRHADASRLAEAVALHARAGRRFEGSASGTKAEPSGARALVDLLAMGHAWHRV